MLGLSQEDLAKSVGVAFQQLQKYETGANRVSASRLWDVAEALGVPVTYFFDGYDGTAEPVTDGQGDFPEGREARELLRYYRAMPEKYRRQVLDLANALTSLAQKSAGGSDSTPAPRFDSR